MKVFISWSGKVSGQVANDLRDWLPSVIQSLKPYVSEEDIDKGARWISEISKELEDSDFGIVSVTPENVESDWLNFEAGALSKSFDASRVAPFLLGLKKSGIKGPIAQFQATVFEKGDILKLIRSLNTAAGDGGLDAARLEEVFGVWWPHLEEKLKKAEDDLKRPPMNESEERDSRDLLEEVLELSRSVQRILSSPEELLPPGYIEYALGRAGRELPGHPAVDDLAVAWNRLERMMERGDLHDPEFGVGLVRTAFELRGPIDFLVREYGTKRRRSARRRENEGEQGS